MLDAGKLAGLQWGCMSPCVLLMDKDANFLSVGVCRDLFIMKDCFHHCN